MEQFFTIADLQGTLSEYRQQRKTIGFVPTMGALHDGHLSLITRAKAENDLVVCSIFVNPTQFNDKTDLEKYPRPVEEDLKKLRYAKCDVVFMPTVGEMYTQKEHWEIDLNGLDRVLEGAHRPGHFQGVTQIVYKLLSAVGASTAYFGQKDYQQFRIISYMVQKFNLQNKLVRCAVVREPDGLAMSSRNVHLNSTERKQALVLSKAISYVKENILVHEAALDEARKMLKNQPGIMPGYLELVTWQDLKPADLQKVSSISDELAVVVAAKVGQTRLIDNAIVKPGETTASFA